MTFTEAAVSDLDEIWLYTADRWGEAQATSYIGAIKAKAVEIAGRPTRGQKLEGFRSGYRRLRSGRHHIYDQITRDAVVVTRILHDAMNPARHLP